MFGLGTSPDGAHDLLLTAVRSRCGVRGWTQVGHAQIKYPTCCPIFQSLILYAKKISQTLWCWRSGVLVPRPSILGPVCKHNALLLGEVVRGKYVCIFWGGGGHLGTARDLFLSPGGAHEPYAVSGIALALTTCKESVLSSVLSLHPRKIFFTRK